MDQPDSSAQPADSISEPEARSRRPPLVSCIVLTWNNFDDTEECLRSLQAAAYPNLRIIVVDNGSTDGSAERLRAAWGDRVVFIGREANDSIPAGYNRGFVEAMSLGSDYVCQVDNDVVVEPGFVEALLEAFAGKDNIALAAPVMLDYYRPDRVWFAGARYIRLLGLTVYRDMGRPWTSLANRRAITATDLAPTCAVMISREALEEVGLLDERLAFSHDDVEWCLRAAARGFRLVLVNQPLASHKISLSRGSGRGHVEGPEAAHDMALGAFVVGRDYVRGAGWPAFMFGRLAMSLPFQLLRMARAGAWPSAAAYLRGTIEGLQYCLRGWTANAAGGADGLTAPKPSESTEPREKYGRRRTRGL